MGGACRGAIWEQTNPLFTSLSNNHEGSFSSLAVKTGYIESVKPQIRLNQHHGESFEFGKGKKVIKVAPLPSNRHSQRGLLNQVEPLRSTSDMETTPDGFVIRGKGSEGNGVG